MSCLSARRGSLATLCYAALCVGHPLLALRTSARLLARPARRGRPCAPHRAYLAHAYAAEAECLLGRPGRALPARRRRKALADNARKTLRGAEKMLAATRPCGSLVRVEKALGEARSLAKRAQSAELVAKVDAVVAAVAARAKTEAKEIERRRIEKAMGAAQSDLVAEPFRALFTGGSTETVGGRPLF